MAGGGQLQHTLQIKLESESHMNVVHSVPAIRAPNDPGALQHPTPMQFALHWLSSLGEIEHIKELALSPLAVKKFCRGVTSGST